MGFAGGRWLLALWVLLGRWSSIFFLLFVLLIFVLQFSSSSWNQRKEREKTQERAEREDRVYVMVLQTIWE